MVRRIRTKCSNGSRDHVRRKALEVHIVLHRVERAKREVEHRHGKPELDGKGTKYMRGRESNCEKDSCEM